MRPWPTILHVDLDAFFAAVEQRDKPSLRGRPVVVGGLGPRGVVATASYEARPYGVHSAMPTAQARARCPHAAYLAGRFAAYREASGVVMGLLRAVSPLVEPLSLDEAYVDLAPGGGRRDVAAVRAVGATLKEQITAATGGLTASVGAGSSKLIAKIASDLDKPDGLVVVPPGSERRFLEPLAVTRLPGVGPATAARLRRIGVQTVADLARVPESDLVEIFGPAHGGNLAQMALAQDDRPVVAERESQSVSVEDTFDRDLVDPALLRSVVTGMALRVCERLGRGHRSGRTVNLKVRLFDFTTLTRALTLPGPTDRGDVVSRVAIRLLDEVDTSGGVRLLGVGVAGLTDWAQESLFEVDDPTAEPAAQPAAERPGQAAAPAVDPARLAVAGVGPADDGRPAAERAYVPGLDVRHVRYGTGWVWGVGHRLVTVRFETATTGPGPVRTFAVDDPELCAVPPQAAEPLAAAGDGDPSSGPHLRDAARTNGPAGAQRGAGAVSPPAGSPEPIAPPGAPDPGATT